MNHEISIQSVSNRHLAVVRDRRRWGDLGAKLLPLLDRVYVAVRAGKVIQTGHNVFLFRDGSKEGVTVEIGVEVASAFEPEDGILSVMTPAGEVARTVHTGPYSGLGGAHEAVIRWCKEHGRERANVWWEVYGDWHEDPAKIETEIFYSLSPVRAPPEAQ